MPSLDASPGAPHTSTLADIRTMGSDAGKTRSEHAELLRFLDAAQLPIDHSSIRKLTGHSQPDFVCRDTSGLEQAFEVTSICAKEVAQLIAHAKAGQADFAWTADPTERIVRQKMHKTYATAIPVDLLCYWDARVVSTDDMIVPTIKLVVESGPNPFRRVWYHGEEGLHLVWDAS